nr:hypothetical protein CFP56_22370 [Quercus suber]
MASVLGSHGFQRIDYGRRSSCRVLIIRSNVDGLIDWLIVSCCCARVSERDRSKKLAGIATWLVGRASCAPQFLGCAVTVASHKAIVTINSTTQFYGATERHVRVAMLQIAKHQAPLVYGRSARLISRTSDAGTIGAQP